MENTMTLPDMVLYFESINLETERIKDELARRVLPRVLPEKPSEEVGQGASELFGETEMERQASRQQSGSMAQSRA